MKFDDILAPHHRQENAALTVEPAFSGAAVPYPFKDIDTGAASLAAVMVWHVGNATNGRNHNVVLACRLLDAKPDFAVWCGDGFLDGTLARERPQDRVIAMTAAHKDLPSATVDAVQAVAGALSVRRSDGCNFWKLHASGEYCKHVKHVLATVVSQDHADQLANAVSMFAGSVAPAAGAPAAAAIDWRERLPFAVPVLLQGDRGSGKTHDVFAFARARSLPLVLLAGHEGIQAIDMLGHLVPYGSGSLVWKDGPLAEAFRRAASEKVVLLIDEVLRIPQRELSVLLTALTPFEGHYHLPTGRMVAASDGVGAQEVLRCPVSNLAVFATTNVGGQYAVDDLDPAIAERFIVFQKDTEESVLRGILAGVVDSRGWAADVVDRLVVFYRSLNALVGAGSLNRAATTRTLVRAVQLAASEAELPQTIEWHALLWVDLDSRGKPDVEQLRLVTQTIADCFGKAKGGKRGSRAGS